MINTMYKKLIVIGAVVAVLVVGAWALVRDRDDSPTSQTMTYEGKVSSTDQAGKYVDYNEATFAQTPGTKILFFHASWCPQCRALEADIKKQGVPAGTTIFKVDYDNAQNLRRKYGVTLQTTVVKVDENGKLLSIFTPYQKPTLKNALSNL